MDYIIDSKNRRVVASASLLNLENEPLVINEFDLLEKYFLEGTDDRYDCELVLLDVEVHDDEMNVVGVETKAFARRKGNEQWLMEFDLENYKPCEEEKYKSIRERLLSQRINIKVVEETHYTDYFISHAPNKENIAIFGSDFEAEEKAGVFTLDLNKEIGHKDDRTSARLVILP